MQRIEVMAVGQIAPSTRRTQPAPRFLRTFPSIPVKDGGGNPWYKPDETFKLGSEEANGISKLRSARRPFKTTCSDLPKFEVPDKVEKTDQKKRTYLPLRATVDEDFMTCLLVRLSFPNSRPVVVKDYFVHEVRWNFAAQWIANRNPAISGSGIRVTADLPLLLHSKPTQIKLDGASANSAEIMQFLEQPEGAVVGAF